MFVCLLATLLKHLLENLHVIFTDGWKWATDQIVNWRSGSPSGYTGIVYRIRHYWEIWKVVNGHVDDHLRGREEFVCVRVQHARVSNGIAPDSQAP